jgi:hypothetical protein
MIVTRALSFLQPWLWAMMYAGKDVENRSWVPPKSIIGTRIALHASKGIDEDAYLTIKNISGKDVPMDDDPVLHRGCIVATAVVGGYVFADTPHPAIESPWFVGKVGWLLHDIRPLETPISTRGSLGLWLVSPGIEVVP